MRYKHFVYAIRNETIVEKNIVIKVELLNIIRIIYMLKVINVFLIIFFKFIHVLKKQY